MGGGGGGRRGEGRGKRREPGRGKGGMGGGGKGRVNERISCQGKASQILTNIVTQPAKFSLLPHKWVSNP